MPDVTYLPDEQLAQDPERGIVISRTTWEGVLRYEARVIGSYGAGTEYADLKPTDLRMAVERAKQLGDEFGLPIYAPASLQGEIEG